jgi:hypothetical protein
VNLAFTAEKLESQQSFEAPLLDINYGVGERIQLKFELPWIFLDQEGAGSKNGLGNSQLGVKWRFLDQASHELDLSIYPQVEFNNPTSSAQRGLVDEGSAWTLPLQVEKGLGPISINLEVGYVVLEEEDEWLYGLAFGYSPFDSLELLAEAHGVAQSDFGDDELVLQAGCRWTVHSNVTLLAAAGRGIRHPEEGELQFVAYLGVQVLFGGDELVERTEDAATGTGSFADEMDHP